MNIGIITETITSLPRDIIDKYNIKIISIPFEWDEVEKYPGENFYQKMRKAVVHGINSFAKTSQPSPKKFIEIFEEQLSEFDIILYISISSKLSGCFNSAIQARSMMQDKERIFILDSENGACGEGIMILKTIELMKQNLNIDQILKELKDFIPKNNLQIAFEDPKYIEASGRISKTQAGWIRRMKKFHLQPIIELKKGGILDKGGIVFAKDEVEALFKKVKKQSKGKKIKIIINHADCIDKAKRLKEMYEKKLDANVLFISLAPMAIAAHAGPGTLIVSWVSAEDLNI